MSTIDFDNQTESGPETVSVGALSVPLASGQVSAESLAYGPIPLAASSHVDRRSTPAASSLADPPAPSRPLAESSSGLRPSPPKRCKWVKLPGPVDQPAEQPAEPPSPAPAAKPAAAPAAAGNWLQRFQEKASPTIAHPTGRQLGGKKLSEAAKARAKTPSVAKFLAKRADQDQDRN